MSAVQVLDMEAVDEARAMFKAKFPTMSGYYFEDAAGYIDGIRAAVSGGKIVDIVIPAHTLKSSSRQMGAALVSGIAKEIEAAAREQTGHIDWYADMLTQLEAAFSDTQAVYPRG